MRIAAAALLGLLAMPVLVAPALAEPQRYEVDADHASVGFVAGHIGISKVPGVFRQVSGSFTFDDKALTVGDIRVEVKTASIDTGHKKRDDHLRSDDFLDARKYPAMTFVAKSGERTGERTGRIAGELTLRGVTRPLVLQVTLNGMRDYPFADKHFAVGVSARGTLRRSDYGMTYGVAEGMVDDEVELVLELEGRRL